MDYRRGVEKEREEKEVTNKKNNIMDKETWIIILVVFLYTLQAVIGGYAVGTDGKTGPIGQYVGLCDVVQGNRGTVSASLGCDVIL